MLCKDCGANLVQNEKFCGNCGLATSSRKKLTNKLVGAIVCLTLVIVVVFGVRFLGQGSFDGENNAGLEETLALQGQEFNLDARSAPTPVLTIEPELMQPATPPIKKSPGLLIAGGRERGPLPEDVANYTGPMYTDHLNWIENSMQMQAGLENFYHLTGVRPHVYIVGEIDGNLEPSSAQVEEFAIGLYDELFTDEAHLLFVFFESGEWPDNITEVYALPGTQARSVMDREALKILVDYIEYYDSRFFNVGDVGMEQVFSYAFDDAAQRIMRRHPEHSGPIVEIEMEDGGIIQLELDRENAPITVDNFISLVSEGFYDGLTFHRVIPGFVIQGGCPLGVGTGGSGTTITGEFQSNGINNTIRHNRGVISMARASDPNSASSQFFITHENARFLDGDQAAFGRVTSGMDVVDRIAAVETDGEHPVGMSRPLEPVVIRTIRIIE